MEKILSSKSKKRFNYYQSGLRLERQFPLFNQLSCRIIGNRRNEAHYNRGIIAVNATAWWPGFKPSTWEIIIKFDEVFSRFISVGGSAIVSAFRVLVHAYYVFTFYGAIYIYLWIALEEIAFGRTVTSTHQWCHNVCGLADGATSCTHNAHPFKRYKLILILRQRLDHCLCGNLKSRRIYLLIYLRASAIGRRRAACVCTTQCPLNRAEWITPIDGHGPPPVPPATPCSMHALPSRLNNRRLLASFT